MFDLAVDHHLPRTTMYRKTRPVDSYKTCPGHLSRLRLVALLRTEPNEPFYLTPNLQVTDKTLSIFYTNHKNNDVQTPTDVAHLLSTIVSESYSTTNLLAAV